jgi:phosphotransferase system HPr-like phosphotransfer protein
LAERLLLLNDIDHVKKFVEVSMMQNFDIELSSGKYMVDAKSIMGIFSLDLTKPVKVIAHCDNSHSFVAFCEQYLYGEK